MKEYTQEEKFELTKKLISDITEIFNKKIDENIPMTIVCSTMILVACGALYSCEECLNYKVSDIILRSVEGGKILSIQAKKEMGR